MTISFDEVLRHTSEPKTYCINESCMKFYSTDRFGCRHTSNTQNCIFFKSALTLNPTYEIFKCQTTINYLKLCLDQAIHDLPIQKIIEEHRDTLLGSASISECSDIINDYPAEIEQHEKKLKELKKNLAAITLP